jgi:hypothetical protein
LLRPTASDCLTASVGGRTTAHAHAHVVAVCRGNPTTYVASGGRGGPRADGQCQQAGAAGQLQSGKLEALIGDIGHGWRREYCAAVGALVCWGAGWRHWSRYHVTPGGVWSLCAHPFCVYLHCQMSGLTSILLVGVTRAGDQDTVAVVVVCLFIAGDPVGLSWSSWQRHAGEQLVGTLPHSRPE